MAITQVQDFDSGKGCETRTGWSADLGLKKVEEIFRRGLNLAEMGSRKNRWKFSVIPRSARSRKELPAEFICPISRCLMADPVIVSSGQTFERNCVEACKELGFRPRFKDGYELDPSTAISNIALKSAISNWCDRFSIPKPTAPEPQSVRKIVRNLIVSRQSEEEKVAEKAEPVKKENKSMAVSSESQNILERVSSTPQIKLSHATTELNRRARHFYSSSSESVHSATIPLLLTTKPSCHSFSSSSSSSEIVEQTLGDQSVLEEPVQQFINMLRHPLISEQEQAVISLRNLTRTSQQKRINLCNHNLLTALRPHLISKYPSIQINAVAALVNLSLEKQNKVKIVRAGTVPVLIDVLQAGQPESQEHASGAIFSLALDDENKTAIGVLGAIPPLLHLLRSSRERARQDAAMAVYHLSLVQSNRTKLMKAGAVQLLMALARGNDAALSSRALLILCNVAACAEGRAALLDTNAVEALVELLRENKKEKKRHGEAVREYCVGVLYLMSQNNLRFKRMALEAEAVEVLREVVESGTESAREKAKRMLMVMKGGEEQSVIPARQLHWQLISGHNSTEF